jgi:hypothetical protein
MGIEDKISGRIKQAAGDLLGLAAEITART